MNFPLQFVPLAVGSLGHLLLDTEKIIFEFGNLSKFDKFKLVFIYTERPVNAYFISRLKEIYPVKRSRTLFFLHRLLRKINGNYRERDRLLNLKNQKCLTEIHTQRPLFSTLNRSSCEFNQFQELVKDKGFNKFVCVVIRDSGFDYELNRNLDEIEMNQLRHTDATWFIPTIKYLNSQGFFVIRMGRHISSQLEIEGLGYIEFSETFKYSNDALEFEIIERCEFMISTGSGPDNIGLLFRKVVLYVNVIPISAIPPSKLCPSALIPTFVLKSTGQKITRVEVLSEPYFNLGPSNLYRSVFDVIPKDGDEICAFIARYVGHFSAINMRFPLERYVY